MIVRKQARRYRPAVGNAAGLILLRGILLCPGPAPGLTEGELRVQIDEHRAKLEKVIESRKAEQVKAQVQEERLQAEITQMRERLERMKKEEAELKLRVASLGREQEEIRNDVSRLQEKETEMRELLTREALYHLSRVEAGIPYNREIRMSDFSLLEKDLTGGRITLREGLERLFALLEQEMYLAGENELYLGTLPREKQGIREVRFLRLGLVSMAYMSSDGKEVGLLRREGDTRSWNTRFSPSLRRAVRRAVLMLEGKEKFGLVQYPVAVKDIPTAQDAE